jgi:osmotically-inducible protein OsmY
MKMKHAMTMAAVIAAMGATASLAETVVLVVPGEAIVIQELRPFHSSAIQTGAMTWDDLVLVEKVAAALEADRSLAQPGITATLVAKDGRVTMSGSGNYAQAQRAERIAKRVAGGANFAGTLSNTGG